MVKLLRLFFDKASFIGFGRKLANPFGITIGYFQAKQLASRRRRQVTHIRPNGAVPNLGFSGGRSHTRDTTNEILCGGASESNMKSASG
jgi:hypothetical protein